MRRYVVSFCWGAPGEEFFSVGIFVSEARSPLIDDTKVALSRWPRTAGEKFFPVEPRAAKVRMATSLCVAFILCAYCLFIVQSFNAAKIGVSAFTKGAGGKIIRKKRDGGLPGPAEIPPGFRAAEGGGARAHVHPRSIIIFHARARIGRFVFPGGPCVGGNLYLCVNNQTNR